MKAMKQRLSPKVAPLLLVAIEQRNRQNGQLGIDLPPAPPPGHTTAPAGVFLLHGDQNISTDPVLRNTLDQVQPDGSWTYGTAAPGQDDFYKAGGIRQTDENGTPLRDTDGHYIYVDRGRVEYDGRGGNDVIRLSPNQAPLADRAINDSTWRRSA